jgi:hypothetical protein
MVLGLLPNAMLPIAVDSRRFVGAAEQVVGPERR